MKRSRENDNHSTRLVLDQSRILRARLAAGYSVSGLARIAGIGLSTAFRAVKGGDVGIETMRKICHVLNVDLSSVLVDSRTGSRWSGANHE
jgi:hypothetical protein